MLNKIKSNIILRKIFKISNYFNNLRLLKYNKNLKRRLDITLKDYILYNQIEIDVILNPSFNDKNNFINIKETDKKFYHFYINKKEIKNNYIANKTKKKKIKVIINRKITSLKALFKNCKNIIQINFIKFKRENIYDMSEMFFGCNSLYKLNLEKIKTNNVIDMSNMFDGCSLLTELNLSNFDTKNVKDMSFMFYRCSNLKKLDITNFNTSNVTNVRNMFNECFSLSELNLKNFNTSKIIDMTGLFCECKSLEKIIGINNFVTNNVKEMNYLFYGCIKLKSLSGIKFVINKNTKVKHMFLNCNQELIHKIKKHNKYFPSDAFI